MTSLLPHRCFCSLCPIAAVQYFIYLPYRNRGSEWRGYSGFAACHLFIFPHLPACLAGAPDWERPDRLFYPHPHPDGKTSSLCYLAPGIKLVVPIAAPLFFRRAGYVLSPVTPTAPTLPLRLENLAAPSFIYHNPSKRAGSWGKWGGNRD